MDFLYINFNTYEIAPHWENLTSDDGDEIGRIIETGGRYQLINSFIYEG